MPAHWETSRRSVLSFESRGRLGRERAGAIELDVESFEHRHRPSFLVLVDLGTPPTDQVVVVTGRDACEGRVGREPEDREACVCLRAIAVLSVSCNTVATSASVRAGSSTHCS